MDISGEKKRKSHTGSLGGKGNKGIFPTPLMLWQHEENSLFQVCVL